MTDKQIIANLTAKLEAATKPNAGIPDFLLEMSKQMNEQPSRCTSHPFWQVRCKRYLITESGYNESHWEIISEDGTTLYHSENDNDYSELFEYLCEYESEWVVAWAENECEMVVNVINDEIDESCQESLLDEFNDRFDPDYMDLPDDMKKLHMQEIEQVVTTHMTQADAEWFIQRKQHDYPKLYMYVESAYWSPQLKELQGWIMELTGGDKNGNL